MFSIPLRISPIVKTLRWISSEEASANQEATPGSQPRPLRSSEMTFVVDQVAQSSTSRPRSGLRSKSASSPTGGIASRSSLSDLLVLPGINYGPASKRDAGSGASPPKCESPPGGAYKEGCRGIDG